MQLSSGAKRDLLVVNLAHALLQVAEIKEQDGVIKIPNTKQRNRIIRRLLAFRETLRTVYTQKLSIEDANWLKKKLQSKVYPMLSKISTLQVELNSFAIYLIYVNFLDNRTVKTDDVFSAIKELESGLFDTLDLLADAIGGQPDDMYELAQFCLGEIK